MAKTYFYGLIVFTGIISLVQSIAWFVLSLLGVLAYRCEMSVPTLEDDKFTVMLYHLYFEGTECSVSPLGPLLDLRASIYSSPSYIHGWMASYLALNITYFFISIAVLINRSNADLFSRKVLRLWCLNTLAFLIMDLWLTIVFGVDFQNAKDYVAGQLGGTLDWVPSVPGALMAIAARGFILWIVNLALFCYFIRLTAPWAVIFGCFQRVQQLDQQKHQQQMYGYPSHLSNPNVYNSSLPRLPPNDPNSMAVVPVSAAANWTHSAYRAPKQHPNAVEGVTSFNDPYGEPSYAQRNQFSNPNWRESDQVIYPRREEIYDGRRQQPLEVHNEPKQQPNRPNVRSIFGGPDRRNFAQGPGENNRQPQKSNDYFY